MNSKPTTVLIVDDIKELADLMSDQLEAIGMKTIVAYGGHEAYQIAKSEDLDFIIADCHMPEGDGLELLYRVKAEGIDKPIMFMMTAAANGIRQIIYSMGAEGFFEKPFAAHTIIDAIAKFQCPFAERYKSITDQLIISQRDIHIDLANIKNSSVEVGRGGLFLGKRDQDLPEQGDIIGLNLQLVMPGQERIESTTISGAGIVRWTRTAQEDGLRPGYGIEFLQLPEDVYRKIHEVTHSEGIISYIPLGRQ